MSFRRTGFQLEEKDLRIDNIPDSGTLTGNWGIDLYGCWWEYTLDAPTKISPEFKTAWIIGEYPKEIVP